MQLGAGPPYDDLYAFDASVLARPAIDLLILDDLGLAPLRHDEPTHLYELIPHPTKA